MGNEMGNSNTSGLQEEENTNTQVPEKSVQEAGHADSGGVENHNASLAEVKNYPEKDNGAATNVLNGAADPHAANHALHEREEKETEVQPPAESPKVEIKSNCIGTGDESNEMEPNYMSDDSKEQEKLPGNTDGAEGENHVVPVAEGEKEINGSSSDVQKEAGDLHIGNHISDEREQETEVLAPAPKFEVKTNNETGIEISDTQRTSSSKHSEDHEANLMLISDHQLEKQKASIKKEEEGMDVSTTETVASSHDPEPQEFEDLKIDQRAQIRDDPPIQDSNESVHIHEDILGSNLNCTSVENCHAIGAMISKDLDGTVVSGSNPEVEVKEDDSSVKEISEEMSCEDRLEIKDKNEIGNGFGKKTLIKSNSLNGVGIKCNGQIPTENSPISTDSPGPESRVTSMGDSLNPYIEVFESTDNCVVLAAETTLTEKESENGESKHCGCTTHSGKELVKESKADGENVSQSELLMIETEGENNQKRIGDFTCCGDNKDYIAKNGNQVDGHTDGQNEASMENCKDTQSEAEMIPESGIVSTKLSLTDCKREEVSEERHITEEIEEKTNASYGIENNTEGRESREQYLSAMKQEKVSLPEGTVSHVQPQDDHQNNEMQSKNIQSSNDSISDLKPESNGDFLVTEASCFDSKNLIAETSVSVAELAIEKHEQDLSQHTAKTMMVAAEANTQINIVSEQDAKVEMPPIASDDYQVQESVVRLSTDQSNSNNSNTHAQMQKSPSFGLDLRIEARTEESDRTPFLCHHKTTTEDFSGEQEVSLSSPIEHTLSDQAELQYQAMPVEEKVGRMEISDPEKLKAPFLGFLKEEEDGHVIVTPQKHDNINAAAKKANKESMNLHIKEVTATSREKRKPRTSLFTTCICCTTVIN